MSMRIALDLFWGIIRQTLQGEGNKTMIDAMPRANDNTKGLLYIMSLHPEGRYKIGWSRSVEQLELQIKEGRIWVPELELVGYWPVLKKWEAQLRFVIASSEPIVNRFAQYPWSDWKREGSRWRSHRGIHQARGDRTSWTCHSDTVQELPGTSVSRI